MLFVKVPVGVAARDGPERPTSRRRVRGPLFAVTPSPTFCREPPLFRTGVDLTFRTLRHRRNWTDSERPGFTDQHSRRRRASIRGWVDLGIVGLVGGGGEGVGRSDTLRSLFGQCIRSPVLGPRGRRTVCFGRGVSGRPNGTRGGFPSGVPHADQEGTRLPIP